MKNTFKTFPGIFNEKLNVAGKPRGAVLVLHIGVRKLVLHFREKRIPGFVLWNL